MNTIPSENLTQPPPTREVIDNQVRILALEIKEKIDLIIHLHPYGHRVTKDVTDFMSTSLADDIVRRVNKFIAGQSEHGGNFLTKKLDGLEEMRKELLDLYWYLERSIVTGK